MSSQAESADPEVYVIPITGQATAATPDEFTGMVVPFKGVVKRVRFVPKTTVTGVATNNFAITVRNRTTGAGAVNVASLTFGNASNATALAATDIPLNATAANLEVAAGDHLSIEKLVNGTGLAMPAGSVQIEIAPR